MLGLVTGLSAFMIATALFAWMSPTIVGLVLAILLSWASGQLALGLWLKRHGFLMTPEEGAPPPIALRANELQAEFDKAGYDDADALKALHAEPELRHAHELMLPQVQSLAVAARSSRTGPSPRPSFVDAETIEDATIWLKPKERMVVLHDRALIGLLAALLPAKAET